MEEGFDIPVKYKDKDLLFPARLLSFGYTYKIEVDVYGTLVHFERDDAGEWRAVMAQEAEGAKPPEVELIEQVALSIERILQ